jgi:hypothetical protein
MKIKKFSRFKKHNRSNPYVENIMLDEDYLPPHKPAAFVPYDSVIFISPSYNYDKGVLSYASMSETDLKKNIENYVSHISDKHIISIEKNQTQIKGDYMIFISLESVETE